MEKTLITNNQGDFKLKEFQSSGMPGVSRTDDGDHINVKYVNRFTMYDEKE